MAYTVTKLAKISGISVRTLHWYDEVGLLKPAYYGSNGYRYYEEEQLLILQQILFYRELGIDLKLIQKILKRSDFDKLAALSAHRKVLNNNLERTKKLIKTIDKTIEHLKGTKKMSNQELYQGFSKEKQEEYEKYLINNWGETAEKYIAEGKKNTKSWEKKDYDNLKKEGDELYKQIGAALKAKLKANSQTVQTLIGKHYLMVKKVYNPTKEVYIGLGQLYIDHPDFRKFFDPFHPGMPEFLAEAMKIFAEKELK